MATGGTDKPWRSARPATRRSVVRNAISHQYGADRVKNYRGKPWRKPKEVETPKEAE